MVRDFCYVRKGNRRLSQASALAVPDLQEDMVREMPKEEGRPLFQEVRLPHCLIEMQKGGLASVKSSMHA